MSSQRFWEWFESFAAPRLDKEHRRASSFRKMCEHLDSLDTQVCIVETGCIEDPDNWEGNGCSTLIFDKYCQLNGGQFYSVEIDDQKVINARRLVSPQTKITCSDSIEYLKHFHREPDLVYLDASHLWWHMQTEAQVHHFNELMAIMPKLQPNALVAVDDTIAVLDDQVRLRIDGKGALVGQYAREIGAELVFFDYQAGWKGFPGDRSNSDWSTDQLLQKARDAVEDTNQLRAYELYQQVLIRTPKPWNGYHRVMRGEACAFLARLALKFERYGTAYDWYMQALEADPLATDYRIELANKVMRPIGLHTGALDQAEKASKIAPDDHYVWRTLGLIHGSMGKLRESVADHEKQIGLSGRSSISLIDKSSTLIDLEEYDEAGRLAEEVFLRDDNFRGDALHCLAMIRARKGEHESAIELYKEALDKNCFDPTTCHFHLSLSLFSIGRYKEGWENQSKIEKNRTDPALFVPMRRFDRPLFKMQPAPAIVHVHAEAGAGDNLAMWRFFPKLKELGYTVRYEIRPELVKLAQDSLPDVEVVETARDYPGALGLKNFDYHLPIGEFPHALGTDIDTIPWDGPYIKADPELVKRYVNAPKIGIAWATGIRGDKGTWLHRYGELKSLSFDLIRPIVQTNPSAFVSLQVGAQRTENDLIANVLPDKVTWADTAALLENLDLVITPDTGLAHLAGAMGKPTWIMMHGHNMGWHFMCERPVSPWNERSPWYPSVRLFRQEPLGYTWDKVIAEIKTALRIERQLAA